MDRRGGRARRSATRAGHTRGAAPPLRPTVRFFNKRTHDTWAYAMLFDHAECLLGSTDDPETWPDLIGAFAAFLAEQGVIPPTKQERLVGEWSRWSDRLLEVWVAGCW